MNRVDYLKQDPVLGLDGKIVLVTGGASGIGFATVAACAKRGAKVVVNDIDKKTLLRASKHLPNDCEFIQADVSNARDVARLTSQIGDRFGGLDVLVNCAGIDHNKTIVDTAEDEWDRVLAVNLKSVFLVSKHCVPLMRRRHGGTIVNISSELGVRAVQNAAAYSVSKAGVIHLTRTMALDLARYNIRVNCVCPGPTLTPLLKRVLKKAKNPRALESEIAARLPLRRLAKPTEMAEAIVFLATNQSSFVTGTGLMVDGGSSAKS